jgi:hypothetical protein
MLGLLVITHDSLIASKDQSLRESYKVAARFIAQRQINHVPLYLNDE